MHQYQYLIYSLISNFIQMLVKPILSFFFIQIIFMQYTCPKNLYYCSSCNYSKCTTCNTLNTFRSSNLSNQCACLPGYYERSTVNNSVCQACDYTCLTCLQNKYYCTKCNSTNLRELSYYNLSCDCKVGYFDNGVPICQKCSSTCLTCDINSTICTSCNYELKRYLSKNFTCLCSPGFFQNEKSICEQCNARCATCNNNYTCRTCSENIFRIMHNESCNCMTGYFQRNGQSRCIACSKSCKTCEIKSHHCTSCFPLTNRFLNKTNNKCDCLPHYYQDQSLGCIACPYTCLTCNHNHQCLSCQQKSHRILESTVCKCQDGYQDAGIWPNCIQKTLTRTQTISTVTITATLAIGIIAIILILSFATYYIVKKKCMKNQNQVAPIQTTLQLINTVPYCIDNNCSICFQNQTTIKTCCGHHFHLKCMLGWCLSIISRNQTVKCPNCIKQNFSMYLLCNSCKKYNSIIQLCNNDCNRPLQQCIQKQQNTNKICIQCQIGIN